MFEINPIEFGNRLRKAIKIANTTQKDLAAEIGVSKTAINNYVGGRIPDAIILFRLSKSLNISIEWLLVGEDYKSLDNMISKDEFELIHLYKQCSKEQRDEIIQNIKIFLLKHDYSFKKSIDTLDEDEFKILELFRRLNYKDKLKIEGIIESKLIEYEMLKKGMSFTDRSGEEVAAKEKWNS
ncbi:MAG TPA: helix-turn-helix transcriptional regulator [Bacillus bacterium]|nr:helix-turn-helix transcriptional regulator [Bacillus sp. (in: firmicutes)]